MTDFPFEELESDSTAIKAFVDAENRRSDAALKDAEYAKDVEHARILIEADDDVTFVTRRGGHVFTFRQTADAPRGQWLSLPDGEEIKADADWQVVFDVDAYCAQTGEDWHWRGAATAWFDPMRVMICLSQGGSDQLRHVEFDITKRDFVPGGFDLPPSRSGVAWRDPDRVHWATAAGAGAATNSSWARVVRDVRRGLRPLDAPVIFEIGADDLVVDTYVLNDGADGVIEGYSRYLAIGQEEVTLRFPGGEEVVLDVPADTLCRHNHSHFAFVVQGQGGVQGALILGQVGRAEKRVLFTPEAGQSVAPESLVFLRDWLLWTERDGMEPRLMALDLRDENAQPAAISLPEECEEFSVFGYDAEPLHGHEVLQLSVRGFLTPPQVYLFDLTQGIGGIAWRGLTRMPARFDTTGMSVQLLYAVSEDGTRVPYHLVLPKDAGEADVPVMMYGYGGYAISLRPGYDAMTGRMWLERGGAYVQAHIRGGAEMGPDWHLEAKRQGRNKSFQDFAAIADDLVARGISRPGKIACHGGSNGGLLCGVMLTRYPEKFGAVWASVGVFDMMRFHKFPAGRAWIDEYGDPDSAEDRDFLLDYSPLHRAVGKGERRYPPWLIDTHDNDDRVDPSHARRMAAQLRALGQEGWFYQHAEGGHGGGGASRAKAEEVALGYAFLRRALG